MRAYAREYDLIIIGTGSAMNYINAIIAAKPEGKIAVIDKDDPGGICLTRGCIPSKLLLYPAELLREIETAKEFGIEVQIRGIAFQKIMEKMRRKISAEVELIRKGLFQSPEIDYYPEPAEFIAPYTLKVGAETLKSKNFFLCTGSKPAIPPIKGLLETGYLTSDTVLELEKLPKSLLILGGGYIGAEYGHFFSAMGAEVTLIGRNSQFLPQEEPEVSRLAGRKMGQYMRIFTNHEALEVRQGKKEEKGEEKEKPSEEKTVLVQNLASGEKIEFRAEEILLATGRSSNSDILQPEKAGIETDKQGWLSVNAYLETSKPGIWAFGDANGKYLLKHVGNYESGIVYRNAILNEKVKADYHAVPHAVFSYPEIASVGLKEAEALEKYGKDKLLIGFQLFEETAKGMALEAKDYFVKVILEKASGKILGAHIIGPHASVLLHQILPLMYTASGDASPLMRSMDIHPALNEVVSRAFFSRMSPESYHQLLRRLGLEP